jgi:hypothetical protein
MPSNEINLFDILALIGFIGFYITLKILVYSKEYGTKENKKDIVIRRGTEWDYEHKPNENKKNK